MKPKVEILREKIEEGKLGGGVKRIEAQHKKGKLTARERVDGMRRRKPGSKGWQRFYSGTKKE